MDEREKSSVKLGFSTKAIHVGSKPDPITGAVMPPIYMTSTFQLVTPGVTKGYDYTRSGNPNFTHFEETLAALENGKHALVFSSGLGALNAMIHTLSPGDKVYAINGIYGGTYRQFTKAFVPFGVEFQTILPKNEKELEKILKKGAKWLLFETPTNPLLDVFDIAGFVKTAKKCGVLTIIDNTFATPYLQNPLDHGADIVWHSTTKYIGGHSDVIGGAIVTNDQMIYDKLRLNRMTLGVNPSPFDVWLAHRGLKTLALRMERHLINANSIAQFLNKHPKVKKVYYPGLTSHPHHALAKKQMRGFGGMVSAEFDCSIEQTLKLIASFKLFTLAESLGGVESLVNHPTLMTHASIPEKERKKMGISDGLIRFSTGIEEACDLIDDLSRAIDLL